MNIEEIRLYCLAKPYTTESMPFGDDTLVFKAGGKMFLLANLEGPLRLNIKASPENVIGYQERYPEAIPAYHMSKVHWVSIDVELCNDTHRLRSWIDDSYQLIIDSLPRKTKQELGISS